MTELSLFDYAALEPDVQNAVQEHTGEIRRLARRSAEDIVEIGQRLKEVKEALDKGGYGQFDSWLKAEFGWARAAAYRFIQVADSFSCLNLGQLNIAPSALYVLASGNTPEFIRREMVEIAQATGQSISHKAAKKRIAAHYAEPEPVTEEEDELLKLDDMAPASAPPETQETPTPLETVDNVAMAPKKKGEGKGKSYTPLQYDFEDVENARGELLKVPVLPDVPRDKEVKQRDFQKAANRFENLAATNLTNLGKLAAYDPQLLCEVVESPEGRSQGAGARLEQLEERLEKTLALVKAVKAQKAIQQEGMSLFEMPPKKDDERTLEALN